MELGNGLTFAPGFLSSTAGVIGAVTHFVILYNPLQIAAGLPAEDDSQ